MSRPRLLLPVAAALAACNAPALATFTGHVPSMPSTGESSSSSSTTGDDNSSGTSIMTSVDGSGSSANSTTEGPPGTSSSTTTSGPSSTTSTSGEEPVCGDGVVEGDEECDDGNNVDTDRCAFGCTKNRWVFASAALHNTTDFGGVEGADSLCRQYALQSGNADDSWKTFIAWISDADHDVRDRLYPGRGRYVRTDGVVVVDLVDEFYSGMLAAPINVDEFGAPAPGGAITGTMPDGTAAPGTHCENWTSNSLLDFSAYTGITVATDVWWTMGQNPDTNPKGCGGVGARLYCIEGA